MFKLIARRGAAVLVLGALTMSSFVNAEAAPRAELPSVTVRYDDLDLNTRAGVDALYARLRAAARDVCGTPYGRGLTEAAAWKTCYRQVLGTAVDNVQSATLSAVHRTRYAHDLS